jgi:hypothetical protein
MFSHIIQNKDESIMNNLLKEINNFKNQEQITIEDLNNKTPLMDNIITESVRFGLLGIGGRILLQDLQFGDKIVPKGNILIHPYYSFGKNIFEDLNKFNPNRYSKHNSEDLKINLFTPFGSGRLFIFLFFLDIHVQGNLLHKIH